ncbi:TerC/Alx family metal homeostasis membrane protein [Nocardioides montaniterrae]
MHVTTLEWAITLALTVGILVFDLVAIARDPREPSMKECGLALAAYVGGAIAFGLWIFADHGHDYGVQFFAGWLTEYSLSIDNLFVFLILMAALKVPRRYQQEALLVGIVLALVFRGVFIALGYTLVENFSAIFYLFGAFLVYTAVKLVTSYGDSEDEHPEDNAIVRLARKHLNVGDEFRGLRPWYATPAGRVISPIVIVIVALGVTDLLFALDSIPAIFGITQEPYLVMTANVFALMGLRQLYFLLGGLLQRLVYLSLGLSFVLAFIGVKLVLHALHENELPFVNGGHGMHVPEISSLVSLAVIVVTLVVTAVVSLWSSRNDERAPATDVDDTSGPDWA